MTKASAKFTVTPPKLLKAKWNGHRLEAPFVIEAEFSGLSKEVARMRYLQQVRGTFKINGVAQRHRLCSGVYLDPIVFHEDGCPAPICSAYGCRSCPPYENEMSVDLYTTKNGKPNMKSGPLFKALDRPGIGSVSGSKIEMDLEFRGILWNEIDAKELDVYEWAAKGAFVVPQQLVAEEENAMKSGRFVDIELLPEMSGGWVGKLYIAGPDMENSSGPPMLSFQISDAQDTLLQLVQGAPVVSEVGSPRNRTWSLDFQIAKGQGTPANVRGTLDNEEFTIDLLPK